jgi:hypothetical protein
VSLSYIVGGDSCGIIVGVAVGLSAACAFSGAGDGGWGLGNAVCSAGVWLGACASVCVPTDCESDPALLLHPEIAKRETIKSRGAKIAARLKPADIYAFLPSILLHVVRILCPMKKPLHKGINVLCA